MSKLRRTLVVAATLAAMNLAGMTAIAQPDDVSENLELLQPGHPDVAGRAQGLDPGQRRRRHPGRPIRRDTRPGPTGRTDRGPGWLVVSLGILAAAMAVVAGLAMPAARRAIRTTRLGQAT